MPLTLEQAAGQMFLLSFDGREGPPAEFLELLSQGRVGGVVLFRHKNIGSLGGIRHLTQTLQAQAMKASQPPLLIAADQEGGQLMAVGHCTPFPGNMALGATGSERLAYQVGCALGRELAALGINVDFAPVCDVNNNPRNPVVGTRSFGEDPQLAATLAAAMIRGLQRSGVAATAKHFPGHGDVSSDSHHGAPVLKHSAQRIQRIELAPFRRAIDAGVRLIMTAHIVVPALNGRKNNLPSTLSPEILKRVLRQKMGFKGVIVSDALDMGALQQGEGYQADVLAAAAAGNDLLLFNQDLSRAKSAFSNLVQATRRGLLSQDDILDSSRRVTSLKNWIVRQSQPDMGVVRCAEHLQLASEVARRSITLVRDTAELLPLRLSAETRIAVVLPSPRDLTPADTSSYEKVALAGAMRRYHCSCDEISISIDLTEPEIGRLRDALLRYELIVMGTIDAVTRRGQAQLINELIRAGKKVIAVALRLPYDLATYPAAQTCICTYSVVPPAMESLADALFGKIDFAGRLPVTIPSKL